MTHEEVILTLALLLKLLEVAPEAIKTLQGDISAVVVDSTTKQKVADAIKLGEDALAELKDLIS